MYIHISRYVCVCKARVVGVLYKWRPKYKLGKRYSLNEEDQKEEVKNEIISEKLNTHLWNTHISFHFVFRPYTITFKSILEPCFFFTSFPLLSYQWMQVLVHWRFLLGFLFLLFFSFHHFLNTEVCFRRYRIQQSIGSLLQWFCIFYIFSRVFLLLLFILFNSFKLSIVYSSHRIASLMGWEPQEHSRDENE